MRFHIIFLKHGKSDQPSNLELGSGSTKSSIGRFILGIAAAARSTICKSVAVLVHFLQISLTASLFLLTGSDRQQLARPLIPFYFLRSLYSSRAIYFPTLYHIFAELEGAVLTSNTRTRVPIGADEDVFPNYSGVGYAIFPAYKVLYIILIVLAGPCSFSHDNAWKKHNRRMYSKIRTN